MADSGRFYQAEKQLAGTHLALHWKGRVRYIVPRKLAGEVTVSLDKLLARIEEKVEAA